MKTSQAILRVCLMATSTLAFIVPEDLPNGIYNYSPDAAALNKRDAFAGWTLVEADVSDDSAGTAFRRRRDETWKILPNVGTNLYCKPSTRLDYFEVKSAIQALKTHCSGEDGAPIGKKEAVVRKYNGIVAFACNFHGDQEAPCRSSELTEAMNKVERDCPNTMAGHVDITPWAKIYGVDSFNSDICGGMDGING